MVPVSNHHKLDSNLLTNDTCLPLESFSVEYAFAHCRDVLDLQHDDFLGGPTLQPVGATSSSRSHTR